MQIKSHDAETATVLAVAQAMAAAARTAPKARGIDYTDTLILTGDDLFELADKMEELGNKNDVAFFIRDAGNIRNSTAVLLLAVSQNYRALGDACGYCGAKNCAACAKEGKRCAYDTIDLGIAIGSAVSVAADAHIDNRVMFSVGAAALDLGLFGEEYKVVLGIPLSATKKSPYFDRG